MIIPEEFSYNHQRKHLQDLNAQTYGGGFEQDLHKIFSQGPVPDHVGRPRGFTRTSARTPHKDLYKMTQRLLTAFHEDLHKIGRVKDLDQDLHARTPKRFSQDHHKRTCCCCCWRIQDPSESHPQDLTYKQL